MATSQKMRGLVDELHLILYPFLLGHGTHLHDKVERPAHFTLSAERRFDSGTIVLEYKRGNGR